MTIYEQWVAMGRPRGDVVIDGRLVTVTNPYPGRVVIDDDAAAAGTDDDVPTPLRVSFRPNR